MRQRIHEYLFSDLSREYICHLLCGHALLGRRLRLLGCYLVFPEAEDYVSHSLASLELKPEWDAPKKELARFTVHRQ